MTEERLKEIKDSIDLQTTICTQLKVDDEMLQEETELYNEVIRLRKNISETIDYLDSLVSFADDGKVEIITKHKYKQKHDWLDKDLRFRTLDIFKFINNAIKKLKEK